MSDLPTMEFSAPHPPDGRHRRWIPVVIAVLAALALALPVAVYLLMRHGDEPAAGPAATTSSSPTPSGSVASPSASTSPSPSTPGATSSAPRAAPDGRISLAVLREATINLPPWPSDNIRGPSGPVRLHNGEALLKDHPVPTGQAPYGGHIVLLSAVYGDVDRDGADETMAGFLCGGQGGSEQLVALDRDRSGHIVTIGPVVSTTGAVRNIDYRATRVSGSGTVTVRVGDYQACCGDETPQVTQVRGYRLVNGRFVQVSGPTRMTLNPYVTETSITAGTLRLGPAADGYRYGTLEVTAKHVRGTHPDRMVLTFVLPDGLQPWGSGWSSTTGPGDTVSVTVKAPPAYGRTTYSLAFRRPAGITGGSLELDGRPSPARLSETIGWDNSATAPITTVD